MRTNGVTGERAAAIIKGVTEGTALWGLLATLHVLSGVMSDTPGLAFIVLVGALAAATERSRVVEIALALLSLLVLIVASSPLSGFIAQRWVRTDQIPVRGTDAIVVLSSGLNPDTTITSDAFDRLVSGLGFVHRGIAPILVTTSVHEIFPTGYISSETDQANIISLITPPPVWWRALGGHSTRNEATGVAALLFPHHDTHIVLVTSPMHTRRACATFAAVGFAVTCTPARMRDGSGLPAAPTAESRLTLFGQWVYEVAAVGEYAARGWLHL